MSLTPVGLLSVGRDGSSPTWLGRLGIITSCTWTDLYPGGPGPLTATIGVSPRQRPNALVEGRILTCYVGMEVAWSGVLDRVEAGSNGWTVYGQGLGSMANDFQLRQTAAWLTTHLADAVSNGLRWQMPPVSLPTLLAPVGPPRTFSDAMNGAVDLGLLWQVTPTGVLTVAAPPVAPTRLVWAVTPPGGRSRTDSPTVLIGTYTSGPSTTAQVVYHSPRAADPVEQAVDLTSRGTLTAAQALNLLTTMWQTVNSVPPWTGTVQVLTGQVTTLTGGVVDVRLLRAGLMVRFAQVDPYVILTGDRPDVVLGQVDVDAVAGSATLTPQQTSRTDLLATLARR